jgi:hypothetical protein
MEADTRCPLSCYRMPVGAWLYPKGFEGGVLHGGGEQGRGLGFRLGAVAMVNMIAGRGTRGGRHEGMNQHVGSVDSTACAGGTKM